MIVASLPKTHVLELDDVSVRNKILGVLFTLGNDFENEIYNMNPKRTQDGLSGILGISRAHVSIETKNLEKENLLRKEKKNIKGGSVKRLTYWITDEGRAKWYEYAVGMKINPRLKLIGGHSEAMLKKAKKRYVEINKTVKSTLEYLNETTTFIEDILDIAETSENIKEVQTKIYTVSYNRILTINSRLHSLLKNLEIQTKNLR